MFIEQVPAFTSLGIENIIDKLKNKTGKTEEAIWMDITNKKINARDILDLFTSDK